MQAAQLLHEHTEIQQLFAELCAAIDADQPHEAMSLRWKINRLLLAHLALEDKLVYPILTACPNRETALLAKQMVAEMGDLASKWQDYLTGWNTARVRAEPLAFKAHTSVIRSALRARIEKEERDLFPRLDKTSCAPNCSAGNCPTSMQVAAA